MLVSTGFAYRTVIIAIIFFDDKQGNDVKFCRRGCQERRRQQGVATMCGAKERNLKKRAKETKVPPKILAFVLGCSDKVEKYR
jgi:hypothetical protein